MPPATPETARWGQPLQRQRAHLLRGPRRTRTGTASSAGSRPTGPGCLRYQQPRRQRGVGPLQRAGPIRGARRTHGSTQNTVRGQQSTDDRENGVPSTVAPAPPAPALPPVAPASSSSWKSERRSANTASKTSTLRRHDRTRERRESRVEDEQSRSGSSMVGRADNKTSRSITGRTGQQQA